MGISSPMKRRIGKGLVKKTGQSKIYLWRDKSIQLMTTNPMYIGHMTQSRQKQALCENQKVKSTPKFEWIVVENTHEAIIDRVTFDLAQEMRLRNTSKFYRNYDRTKHIKTENHLLKGLLLCGGCGSKLVRRKTSVEYDSFRYVCIMQYKGLGTGCTVKSISEAYVLETVLNSLKIQVKVAVDLERVVEKLNNSVEGKKRKTGVVKELTKLQTEMNRLTGQKTTLFESYIDKLLTEEKYIYSKNRCKEQIDEIKTKIKRLQDENIANSKTFTPQNKWLQEFIRFTDHDELTFEMVNTLISRIIFHTNEEFSIVWNFKNDYEAIENYARQGAT